MKISVIIPVLNEAGLVKDAVEAISPEIEVIVVDGQSSDATLEEARSTRAGVFSSPPGRGTQMDLGAGEATGECLLFLHADTRLPSGFAASIKNLLTDDRVVGGAFTLSIDAPGLGYRIIEWGALLRSKRLGLIYGDQAIFTRADCFRKTGGFRGLPLMEDVDLARRLRRAGRVAVLGDRVVTSPRRWRVGGLVSTTLKNWSLISLYFAGLSPERLYHLYYGKKQGPRG